MTGQHVDTARPGRCTIGLLSEFAAYDSESQLFLGAQEAAQALDANLLYILPLNMEEARHYGQVEPSPGLIREKHLQLKAYLDAFRLDGLIYIGWARAFQGEEGRQLRALLHPLPMISISGNDAGHPSVEMLGAQYIEDATRHLIAEHARRHIAYVSSWQEDARLDGYERTMRDHGLFDDELIVRVEELAALGTLEERIGRAAAILLDERKKPVDAMILLTAYDSKVMLEQLQKRGYRVPHDIALISYEDHPVTEFAEPPLTAIYYPFYELGREACRKLHDILRGRPVPQATPVPARIIYRDSCGCTTNKVKPMRLKELGRPRPEDAEGPLLSPAAVAGRMREDAPLGPLDYERIADDYLSSIGQGGGRFLETLRQELDKLDSHALQSLPSMLDRMRLLLLPHVAQDPVRYAMAEAAWFGARYIAKDYENAAALKHYIRSNEQTNIISVISQRLLPARSVSEIPDILHRYLGWIGIPTVNLLLAQDGGGSAEPLRMLFAHDECRLMTDHYPAEAALSAYYAQFLEQRARRVSGIILPLKAGSEMLGYAMVEPGAHGTSPIIALMEQTSNAIKSAMIQEESREKEARLAYYADMDSLTGLFNRRYFYDALSMIRQSRDAFSVFYVDIDGFKAVNDRFGHDAGDLLLAQIADRLKDGLQDGAFALTHAVPGIGETELRSIFRLGGDEFTALLAMSEPASLADCAASLCETLSRPYSLNGQVAQVTASIGIARYPQDTTQLDQLLKYADMALYSAKGRKNRSVFFHDLAAAGARQTDK